MKKLFVLLALVLGSTQTAHAAYYETFTFRPEGTCANMRGLWFRQAASWFRAELGRDAHGRRKVADFTLQLFPSHQYWLDYSEVVITRYLPNGGTEGIEVFRTRRTGTWAQQGRNLVLPGLFTAEPARIADHGGYAQGFAGRFTAPLGDPRLPGVTVVFGEVRSKMGPRGISVSQYCRP